MPKSTLKPKSLSRAQLIRNYLEKNPSIRSNKDVVAGLKKQGVSVTEAHVSVIKSEFLRSNGEKPKSRTECNQIEILAAKDFFLACNRDLSRAKTALRFITQIIGK